MLFEQRLHDFIEASDEEPDKTDGPKDPNRKKYG